jgi:hypothetical protein
VQGTALRGGEKGPNSGEEASSSNTELESKALSGAQLARTEQPLAAKTKTHQWTEQEPLEPRAVQCVEGEDQTEHTGRHGR